MFDYISQERGELPKAIGITKQQQISHQNKIIDIVETGLGIILLHDKYSYAGPDYYTLIQGYALINENEETAAKRILKEKTGLQAMIIEELKTKDFEEKPVIEQLLNAKAQVKSSMNHIYIIKAEGTLKPKTEVKFLKASNIRNPEIKGNFKEVLYKYLDVRDDYIPRMESIINY